MEARITIITLGVKDLVRSTDFYVSKFGWTKTADSNENITFLKLEGMLLALYPRKELAADATVASDGQGFSGVTLAYNTRTEVEVDEIITRLEQAGVDIVKRPQKASWGGYSSYVADCDGYLWEIAYNPYLQLDDKGRVA